MRFDLRHYGKTYRIHWESKRGVCYWSEVESLCVVMALAKLFSIRRAYRILSVWCGEERVDE